jgi:hypothetical protein
VNCSKLSVSYFFGVFINSVNIDFVRDFPNFQFSSQSSRVLDMIITEHVSVILMQMDSFRVGFGSNIWTDTHWHEQGFFLLLLNRIIRITQFI